MESPRGTPTRLFKSCRRCRKQKMRCDARHQIPCSRCQATGHDCVVDTIDRGRNERRNQNKEQTRFNPLSPTSSSLSSVGSFNNRGSTGQSSLEIQHFTSQDMMAPQSAMHSMSVNLGAPDEQIFIGESENDDPTKDVIARGIITEEQARGIYERFMNGSKNFLPLFDPVRDTFDSIRSRSLFCFTVIIYLASRAVPELRSNSHLQRVLQDEAQKLAEDSFFERPTKLETVQGMILLAAYSEKSWFSTALILRTALDSGLEKSLDTLLAQTNTPRSYLSATMEDRILVWQTRTWLITYTTELDIAAGTGRKSRVNELDVAKLRKYLDYPLSLPSDMRTVSVIEIHQLRARARRTIDSTTAGQLLSTELPAIMRRLEEWWKTWDGIHDQNGFHAGAFQRSSLKYMLNYARVYVLCATIARIQKRPSSEVLPDPESDAVLGLWKSLVEIIMGQMALLVNETAYRCQLTWSPTYPALTIAFITTFAVRVARWHPALIDQSLVLQRAQQMSEILKLPPYPDIHRTVSIFSNYASALFAERSSTTNQGTATSNTAGCSMQPRQGTDNPRSDSELFDMPHDQGQEQPPQRDAQTHGDTLSEEGRNAEARPDPALPRLLGEMNIPNWTLSTSIADSFDLFEEGQSDVFDFLPSMPSIS
ncbi:Zn(II)2Cys6 transcription factor [Aspergillus udagawae]|uniref:Zn(2)-C6 fungal-type domain-containing protein n=1 Tax=Aspergillus udagawae TaxID=91492 RepID=A0A8E0V0Y7_9EURO|nr:uncharacterized protein Aud_009582 [Aspergillus udagawae]GIC93102.1 hypothetical protein Aud_009582 [Aspergillus udagawae]